MIKDDFINSLKGNKIILKQFFGSMTEDEINKKTGNNWTIYEHIAHLAVTQIMLMKRMETFIKEENPVIVPYTPDNKPNPNANKKPASALIETFSIYRDKQIGLIEKADSRVWENEGKHEEYKKYNFEILIRHIIFHDAFHMYRMEELLLLKEQYINELK